MAESLSTGEEPSVGFDWGMLVGYHSTVLGGLTALADELVRRVGVTSTEALDLEAAKRGLRRLEGRGNRDGGQYGRWLLRLFGMPPDVVRRLRYVAQYHSRFSDLPDEIRREQVMIWQRPPVTDSNLIAWVWLALASIELRAERAALCRNLIVAARQKATPAGATAMMEIDLLDARQVTDMGQWAEAEALLDRVDDALAAGIDEAEDALCYRVRVNAQRAFVITHRDRGPEAYRRAQELFHAVADDSGIPFVDYRRTAGLAHCAWKLGDAVAARKLAFKAAEHAGDGGFVRFRAMAYNMLARMHEGVDAVAYRDRADRLARSIGDLHIRAVIQRHR